MKNQSYALTENGSIHTDDLDLASANEMLERHKRFFPNCTWDVIPMGSTKGMENLSGFLENHRRSAVRYRSVK
jgi:hypothetical protein